MEKKNVEVFRKRTHRGYKVANARKPKEKRSKLEEVKKPQPGTGK